ncbi:MAG: thioredoxin family protein [Spirochaetia bacterium]|nr:thioredoxin family protein [Spirochaetia bacterium]
MKKRYLLILIIMPALTGCTDAFSGQNYSVEWNHSLVKALQQSRAENRPVLVNFHSDKCLPCIRMKKEFFTLDTFGELIEKYRIIPVIVEAEKDPEKMALVLKRYGVHGYPTLLILEGKGRELGRSEGYRSADIALDRLEKIMRDLEEKQ